MKRGRKPKKTEFTRVPSGCILVTIQAVYAITEEIKEHVSGAIDTLSQYGAAEVVAYEHIAEDEDEALKDSSQ